MWDLWEWEKCVEVRKKQRMREIFKELNLIESEREAMGFATCGFIIRGLKVYSQRIVESASSTTIYIQFFFCLIVIWKS